MNRVTRAIRSYLQDEGAAGDRATDAAREISEALEKFSIERATGFREATAAQSLALSDLERLRHGVAETLSMIASLEPQTHLVIAYAGSTLISETKTVDRAASPSLSSLQEQLDFIARVVEAVLDARKRVAIPEAPRLFAACISARRDAVSKSVRDLNSGRSKTKFFRLLMERLTPKVGAKEQRAYREAFDEAVRFIESGEFDGLRRLPLDFIWIDQDQ